MKINVIALLFLIITIALSSCGKSNGEQILYPCLNNYYMVEYLNDSIIISQMTRTDTLKRINNEMFLTDGSLLLSTMRDTTFLYYANGQKVERAIFKTDEGYETTSTIYTGHNMLMSVSFIYDENYEIARIHQVEKVDFLPQEFKTRSLPKTNAVYFYPQMRKPKLFYTEYTAGRLLLGSSSNQYVSDTLCIDNGNIRNRDGSLFLSINGDTVIKSHNEDGNHQIEIRKIGDNEYVYSNYLERHDALGAYVYGKRGGKADCYISGNDNISILLVSYTYTSDFRIIKRQSFEEVLYLLKTD